MNYVWTISAEKVFSLALFIVYGNHSDGNVCKLSELKNRRFV